MMNSCNEISSGSSQDIRYSLDESNDDDTNNSDDIYISESTVPKRDKLSQFIAGKESIAWRHFVKVDDKFARCNWCNKTFAHSGGTTNLLSHVKRIHPMQIKPRTFSSTSRPTSSDDESSTIVNGNMKRKIESSSEDELHCGSAKKKYFSQKPKLGTIVEAFSRVKSFQNGENAGTLTNTIAYMIAVDHLPFSFVEGRGFRKLMKLVAPLYNLTGRKSFTKKISERYVTLKENLISMF